MTFRHDLNCEPKPLRTTGILFGILGDFGRTGVTEGVVSTDRNQNPCCDIAVTASGI